MHERLENDFGRDLVFMDVDSIPLGANFVNVLREEVTKCDAMLALIGPDWLDARDENGNRRLENPNDFVRVELGTALKRGIPVIPILLEGALVPKADKLPDDIKELSLRVALDVRHTSFSEDMARLIRRLKGAQSPHELATGVPPLVDCHRTEDDIKVDATIAHRAAQAGKRLLPIAIEWLQAKIVLTFTSLLTPIALHSSVLLLIVAVLIAVAYVVPYTQSATSILFWAVPVFGIYLSCFFIYQAHRKSTARKRRGR